MLTIHRAERADTLLDPLASLLLSPLVDPLAPELISVPSKGVERWIMQQLSLHLGTTRGYDGIAANILFPNPQQLIAGVISSVDRLADDENAWSGNRLVWAVLEVMDESAGEPWSAMLSHHLGREEPEASHRQGRRFSTALKLAQLFASYSEARPSMLIDWLNSQDTDGFGLALRHDMVWQAHFWRRLREQIGVASPAERLAGVCATLRDRPDCVDLPERLSIFGPTRLSRSQAAVLNVLAAGRDVHVWLAHPSPVMWQALRDLPSVPRRADDQSALFIDNPLLANLSRDIRELQQVLKVGAEDRYHEPATIGSTVLARLQDDIRHCRPPSHSPPIPHDRSVTINACHGHLRQVEVLREELLHLFNDDPTLEGRDVIVLCPDVDTFAPLVAAAFGPTGAPHPGHQLRIRLADRGPAHTNALLQILRTLLDLGDGRVSAGEVLDLIAIKPVAWRFDFSESELETLRNWIVDGGARWGIDDTQRELFGLSGVRQNTLSTARDRLLAGVCADDSELAWLGTALPLSDVDSSDIDLVGRYAEFLDRLNSVLRAIRGPHTARRWNALLIEALDLLTEVGEAEIWQRHQAGQILGTLHESTRDTELTLSDMRALLAHQIRPRPTRSNFRTGEITVATMVPMRFVPHRVVAVIGLDDEAFPRAAHIEGDDILALDPCLGERDPRSEDRQLLLDALMSATDNLIICYNGVDPVTGARRPPPAPLADIIDAATATVEPDAPVVSRRPLQPFDASNFSSPDPFSFDVQAQLGAIAAQGEVRPVPLLVPTPLATVSAEEVTIADLVDFFCDPTMGFLRQRMAVNFPREPDEISDVLPVTLTGLARWQVGDRLLQQVLTGSTIDDVKQAELRRGTLPPGQLGVAALDEIAAVVDALARAATTASGGAQLSSVHLELELGSYVLTGTVGDLYGTTLINASFSTLAPKHRIAGWVRLLAICSAGITARAEVIGRHYRAGKQVTLHPPSGPAGLLTALLDIRAAGLREPLPLGTVTSYGYVLRRRSVGLDDAYDHAASAWTSTNTGNFRTRGENDEKSIGFVYGSDAPFSVWWDQIAQESERWSDLVPAQRFAQLACHVYGPLIENEESRLLR